MKQYKEEASKSMHSVSVCLLKKKRGEKTQGTVHYHHHDRKISRSLSRTSSHRSSPPKMGK